MTLLALLRARLSGTRAPPDSSLNSRYDTTSCARMHALATSHLPAPNATKLTPPQFVQSLSNPYYLHHLCVQKYFEDDKQAGIVLEDGEKVSVS